MAMALAMSWVPKRLAGWLDRIDARAIDEVECVASVLLAILVAHLLGAGNISWAAFAGYMVMRGHALDTVSRGMLRIVGTVSGGLLALVLTPFAVEWRPLAALLLFAVGTASLYAALTAKRSYAWLFFGLTFAMVLCDKLEHPGVALISFVQTRILETVAGTLACVIVSVVSTLTLRQRWGTTRMQPPVGAGWHPQAFGHAAKGGAALAILAVLPLWVRIPDLAQSAVSIMAVMLVPLTGIGPSGLVPVSTRILYRFIGCICGGLLAGAVLFAAHGSAVVLILGTMLGVALGRHIENGPHSFRYVGTQFTLAVLVTLVPDSYANAAIGPALDRLIGILVGLVVLEPVLVVGHFLRPVRSGTAGVAQPDEPGGI